MNRTQTITLPFIQTRLEVRTGASILLILSYLAGIVGILMPIHEKFILLTPLNLLFSLLLVLVNHPVWSRKTWIFLGLCYVVGFGAELFGVQTGMLFGEYTYGPVLGLQVWGTPLMIGVNWMLVAYGTGVTANWLAGSRHWVFRAVLGALLLVGLDWFIEPVAIHYDFWTWTNGEVPLRNYVGWFIVALPLQMYFAYYQANIRNNVGVLLFILQLIFFVVLGIFTHL